MFLQRKHTYGVRYTRAEGMPLIELGNDENSIPEPEKVCSYIYTPPCMCIYPYCVVGYCLIYLWLLYILD